MAFDLPRVLNFKKKNYLNLVILKQPFQICMCLLQRRSCTNMNVNCF